TLEDLKQQGKIRYWGIACERVEDVPICLRYAGLASIQVSLSLLHQEALDVAIPRAAARGLGVIARQVFASGSLARDDAGPMDESRKARIEAYKREAHMDGHTLPETALQFVLKQPSVSVALLGMHRPSHLQASLGYL